MINPDLMVIQEILQLNVETLSKQELELLDKRMLETYDPIIQVKWMNHKYGFDKIPLTKEILNFKLSCLLEELSETMNATNVDHNADGVVDGLVDLCVFALGNLYNGEVDIRQAFTEVMRANLKKVRGTKPTRPNSGGIDLVKPEGWTPPSHLDNLGQFKDLFNEKL